MASPIGHALAGIAVAWGSDLVPGLRSRWAAPSSASWYDRAGGGLTLTCALLAAAPDLDLLFGRFHRTVTHSFLSVAIVAVVAGAVAGGSGLPREVVDAQGTRGARGSRRGRGAGEIRERTTRIVIVCAGAWATHLLLDWLSVDRSIPRGIQVLWPFDDRWFISGWDLFLGTERRQPFSSASMRTNAEAVARELVILAPIVVVLWLVRVKALAGLSSQLARGDHPPQ